MLIFVEIAMGLALIYALGALVCSVLHEGIAQCFHLRWKNLASVLKDMLGDHYPDLMAHPLMKDLWDDSRQPTAIPDVTVARALVHAFETTGDAPLRDAKALLEKMPVDVQRQIVPFLARQEATVEDLYEAARTWFETSMVAASDWYGRQAHWLSIAIGIAFAIAFNIDTMNIATTLAEEPQQRAALAQTAQQISNRYAQDPTAACPKGGAVAAGDLTSCLNVLSRAAGDDLVGWNAAARNRLWPSSGLDVSTLLVALLGWVASGLAMSLGARFWFDTLSSLVSMRAGLDPQDAAKKAAQPAIPIPQ